MAPPPLIVLGFFLAGLAIDRLAGMSFGMPREARWIVGLVLSTAGLAFIAAALNLFIKAGTRAEPWQPTSVIVEGGIHRRSRNPMYVGMALVYLGGVCLLDSAGALFLFAPLMLVVHYGVVAGEERYLEGRFGEPYRAYCTRVRRWL